MYTFKKYYNLIEDYSVHTDEKGTHYTSYVGPHKIRTMFFPDGNDRHEIGFELNDSDEIKDLDKLNSRERQAAIFHVVSHVKHFVNNNKPLELYARGNTERKKEAYKNIINIAKNKIADSDVTHSSTKSTIKFPPTEEQSKMLANIKATNIAKMKAIKSKSRFR